MQEHRFYHNELDVKYHDMFHGWTLVIASAWKNSTNTTIGGTRMLLSHHANSSLSRIERINRRTIAATFAGNPIITVISCYSPTNISEDDDVTNFYRELSIYIIFQTII